jgi:hypothetical protein
MLTWLVTHLKQNLQCKLNIERFSRADAGAPKNDPIVEPIVPHFAREGCTGGREVDAVEDVEHLDTELGVDPLSHWGVLEKRKIDIGEARILELVAALCAVRAGSWIDKGRPD